MTTHSERIDRLPVETRRLWAGLITAPAAWVVAELAGYYMASRSREHRAFLWRASPRRALRRWRSWQ
jgi:hypothetical protein